MIIIERSVKLTHLCKEEALSGMTFTGESSGHKFVITQVDETGTKVPLTGSVSGKFLRADGTTIALIPSEGYAGITDGSAWVILAGNCYTQDGPFRLVITHVNGTELTDIYAFSGYVRIGETGTIVDPENVINIDAIAGMIDEMETATDAAETAAAFVPNIIAPAYSASATYAVGDYVTKDGYLYRCNTAISTAEAWTAAHWTQVTTGAEVSDLKSALNFGLFQTTFRQSDWTSGTLSSVNGSTSDSDITIRTGYITDKIAGVSPAAGYKIAVHVYDGDDSNAFLGCITDAGIKKNEADARWQTSYVDLRSYPNNYVYRLLLRDTTNAEITTSVYTNALIYYTVDKTLTGDGVSADSKTVGDRLTEVGNSLDSISGYNIAAGYKPVEYLESSGDGYVSMGTKLNGISRVVCDFSATSALLASSATEYLFGCRANTSSKGFVFGVSGSNSHKYAMAYNTEGDKPNFYCNNTNRHIVDFNQNTVYLDGTLIKTFTAATFETPSNALMFAVYGSSGTTHYYYGQYRIYGCKVYDSGTLIREFVPAVRMSDSKAGMYDVVNNVFYESTGTFTVGSSINVKTNAEAIASVSVQISEINSDIDEINEDIDDINAALTGRAYIQTEADRVAEKVRSVQTGKTLTFVGVSDMHYNVDSQSGQDALRDMADGVKAIAGQVNIDFYCAFGDMIYRLSSAGNYEKGYAEAVGMTKLLNGCFSNNKQIRLVGNHDPNTEGSTGYFPLNLMNAFSGLFTNMIEKQGNKNNGIGHLDLEDRKVRVIVLNTSYYGENTTLQQESTRYYFGDAQARWLCEKMAELSEKEDADEWQIVIIAHIAPNYVSSANTWGKVAQFCDIFRAYEAGGTASWTLSGSTSTYDFSGKNTANLALYINGHRHRYYANVMEYLNSSGNLDSTLKMTTVEIPHALYEPTATPQDRAGVSMDGETYIKTANSATSTSFEVITIDFDNHIVYAHHYGAGVDIILHYASQNVETTTTLTTSLSSPTWDIMHDNVVTVSNGVVTAAAEDEKIRNTVVFAKSTTDNCIEAWNIHAGNAIS